jgi:hypothetical protein
MPNKALSRPAYKPTMPSRSMMRLAAERVPVDAFLFSTCALVDKVIKGYLYLSASFRVHAGMRIGVM